MLSDENYTPEELAAISSGYTMLIDESSDVLQDLKNVVIVTGMSGGGKTQASRYLEDLGYFCVDNLPPVFIPKFVELCAHAGGHVSKVVLVVDTRSREFFDTFVQVLEDMDKSDASYEMLFMDASDAAIIRRYKESRRRHPMAPASRISEGIAKERERLAPVRAKATYIIDTSELKKVQLRDKIHRLFGAGEGEQMNINVRSFGFKFGMPLDADMVRDVRFLLLPPAGLCIDLHAAHLCGAVGLDHAPAVCAVGKVPAAVVISGHHVRRRCDHGNGFVPFREAVAV